MLGPLDRYGRWLEQIGRYTSARLLYARALTIAEQTAGRGTPLAIDPLLGIARSYRLEFVNGAEEAPAPQDAFGNADLSGVPMDGQRLNPDGERALRLALQAIEKTQPMNHHKRGETLVELGDWFMSAGGLARGVETYREAWKDFAQAGDTTSVLTAPRLLAYRPPPSSARRSSLKPDESEDRFVEVKYSVTKDGRTEDVEVGQSDASESTQRSMVSAVKKARFSPRFEAGEPVETKALTMRERILVKAKQGSNPG